MTPDVVVDIGNSRMKWGVCRDVRDAGSILTPADVQRWKLGLIHDDRDIGYLSLPPERGEWDKACRDLNLRRSLKWAVASVNPAALNQFTLWLSDRGDSVVVVDQYTMLPIKINVDFPERVGIDRLLNAIGATRRLPPETPGIIIDAGTAITVDLIDTQGVFQGGAILPGLQLMLRSLHEHTAKLPLINEWDLHRSYDEYDENPPGKNTENAIVAGVTAAVQGGIELLVRDMSTKLQRSPCIIATGGMGNSISLNFPANTTCTYVEKLTLEGIRIAAESLP